MMNKRPVVYHQTDHRWKDKPYRVKGETATIGGSGCGPTCAAMVLETLTGQTVTPVDTCAWSVQHGYKALNQGTYYSYFAAQFAAYSIPCRQLLGSRLSNQPDHPVHDQVRQYLSEGYYVIALMGPGLWTRSGHYVLLWAWDDKVRINDPASSKAARLNGGPATFRREVRNYWLVDARACNKGGEDLTEDQVRKIVREELEAAEARRAKLPVSDWAKEGVEAAKAAGITDGTRPQSLATRQEVVTMIQKRFLDVK